MNNGSGSHPDWPVLARNWTTALTMRTAGMSTLCVKRNLDGARCMERNLECDLGRGAI